MMKGKITHGRCRWGSGLMELWLEDEDGTEVRVVCESSTTIRALNAAFHDANDIVGQWIEYELDEYGVMLGFTPVEGPDAG